MNGKIILNRIMIMLSAVLMCLLMQTNSVKGSEYDEISDFTDDITVSDENSEYAGDDKDAEETLLYQELSESVDGFLISASGNMPEGAYITAEHLTLSDDYEEQIIDSILNTSTDKGTEFEVYEVFNIDIYSENGDKWQPYDFDEYITVTICGVDLDDGTSYISEEYGLYEDIYTEVYRIEDNNIDLMETQINSSELSVEFITEHFSMYLMGTMSVPSYEQKWKIGNSSGRFDPMTDSSSECDDNIYAYLIKNDDNSTYTLYMDGEGAMAKLQYNGLQPWSSYRNAITCVIVSDGITNIGASIFSSFYNLTDLTIGEDVEEIDVWAFSNCNKLKDVILPDSLVTIETGAFQSTYIQEISFGRNLTEIGQSAFSYTSLSSLVIPDNVSIIGDYAFGNISYLTDITIGSGLTSMGSHVFSNIDKTLTKLTTENTVALNYDWAGDNRALLVGSWNAGNSSGNFGNISNPATECDSNVVVSLYINPGGTTYAMKIEGSGKMAGYSNETYRPWSSYAAGITELELSFGLDNIGQYVCTGLGITNLNIPFYVNSIDYSAFSECNSLTTIETYGNNRNISIEKRAFYYSGSGYLDTTLRNLSSNSYSFISYNWRSDKRNVDLSEFLGSFTYKGVTYNLSDATSVTDDMDKYWFEEPGILYIPVNSDSTDLPSGAAGNVRVIYYEDGINKVPSYISNYYSLQTSLEEVRLPVNDVAIGDCAFMRCSFLHEIDLSNVVSIGYMAFLDCARLTELCFSNRLSKIETRAFMLSDKSTVATTFSGSIDNTAVLEYGWVSSKRVRQPKYKIISADNEELIIEENFTDELKVSSVNLMGYKGNLYLDSDCTIPFTLPYYSFEDVTIYLDIYSGEVFSSAKILSAPSSITEISVYDASALSSHAKYRDGSSVPIDWITDITPEFIVNLTGLKVEIKTSELTKETLEYTQNTSLSEDGATINGFSVKPVRLYNDDFEFDKNSTGFKLHDSGTMLETEKLYVIPGNSISMSCDILISADGFKKVLTVPVTVSVIGKDLEFPEGGRLMMSGVFDYTNYPNVYQRDSYINIYLQEGSPSYGSKSVGVLTSEHYRLYKHVGPYFNDVIYVADDEVMTSGKGYDITPNPGNHDKDILFDGSYTYYSYLFNFYDWMAPSSPAVIDYRLDVYYDLRQYGGGLYLIQPELTEAGGFYLDPAENLDIDKKKYGSVRYEVFGILKHCTMDDDFDFETVYAQKGIYEYGVYDAGARIYQPYHKSSADSYYADNHFYVFYVVPLLGATLESSYSVKLPAAVELTKNVTGAGGSFEVFTKGTLGSLNTLHIFVNNPDINKLTGIDTRAELPFTVSRTSGSDYFYYDTITEDYPANGNKYDVSISEASLQSTPVDTYTGNINIEYRVEPVF